MSQPNSPREWARELANRLGEFLRADPVLATGGSVIEQCVKEIQEQSRHEQERKPEATGLGQGMDDQV